MGGVSPNGIEEFSQRLYRRESIGDIGDFAPMVVVEGVKPSRMRELGISRHGNRGEIKGRTPRLMSTARGDSLSRLD